MSCYHPLKAFPVGINPETGKTKYKITSYEVDHLAYVDGKYHYRYVYEDYLIEDCLIRGSITIPCGKCVGCKLDRSRDWATRCMLELMYHDESYFLTITYDEEHVPHGDEVVSNITGEIRQFNTLLKTDWQKFMKELRQEYHKKYPDADKLRFYMCGEYGSNTHRPHYHAIVFGLHLDDLVYWNKSHIGYKMYRSPFLEKVWHRGIITVGQVTWETCAYTARYIMKKLDCSDEYYYDDICIERPFTLMSRKPGIAHQYFDEHPDLYDFNEVIISTDKGGKKYPLPKYYDRLFDVDNHDELQEIKEVRKTLAQDKLEFELSNTSLDYLSYLEAKEAVKLAQISSLKREEV